MEPNTIEAIQCKNGPSQIGNDNDDTAGTILSSPLKAYFPSPFCSGTGFYREFGHLGSYIGMVRQHHNTMTYHALTWWTTLRSFQIFWNHVCASSTSVQTCSNVRTQSGYKAQQLAREFSWKTSEVWTLKAADSNSISSCKRKVTITVVRIT